MNATDDWFDVERLTDHSWRIAEGVVFNSYLVEGSDRALVIDAGAGVGDLRGMAEELVDVPVTLLVTHSHWDHIGAAHQFDDVVAHGREHDDGRLTARDTGEGGYGVERWVEDWQAAGRGFPDGFDPGAFEIPPATGVRTVEPGGTIDLGGRRLALHHVPGHSPGQLAALDRADGVLYGSDVIHNDHSLYIHFRGCDVREYLGALEHVCDLRDGGAFETLYLSHVRPVTGDDLDVLDEYREGLEAILAGDLEYDRDEESGARRYEVAGYDVLVDPDAL